MDNQPVSTSNAPFPQGNHVQQRMSCQQCPAPSIQISSKTVQRPFGVLNALMIIPLIFIPFIGWIVILFIVLSDRSVTIREGMCQNCGSAFYLDPYPKPSPAGLVVLLTFLGVAISVLLAFLISPSESETARTENGRIITEEQIIQERAEAEQLEYDLAQEVEVLLQGRWIEIEGRNGDVVATIEDGIFSLSVSQRGGALPDMNIVSTYRLRDVTVEAGIYRGALYLDNACPNYPELIGFRFEVSENQVTNESSLTINGMGWGLGQARLEKP